jgi:hypothetical protein
MWRGWLETFWSSGTRPIMTPHIRAINRGQFCHFTGARSDRSVQDEHHRSAESFVNLLLFKSR